jgi:ABC-type Fe3+ transport system permease subunit
MANFVHGIAIVVGFALYIATKNIIAAAVVAVTLEAVILAVLKAGSRIKSSKEQFAKWQAGTAEAPPLKKLWWRIAIIVVFGLQVLFIFSLPVIALINTGKIGFTGGSEAVYSIILLILILCIPIVLAALSIKKAKEWNQTIQQGNVKVTDTN